MNVYVLVGVTVGVGLCVAALLYYVYYVNATAVSRVESRVRDIETFLTRPDPVEELRNATSRQQQQQRRQSATTVGANASQIFGGANGIFESSQSSTTRNTAPIGEQRIVSTKRAPTLTVIDEGDDNDEAPTIKNDDNGDDDCELGLPSISRLTIA